MDIYSDLKGEIRWGLYDIYKKIIAFCSDNIVVIRDYDLKIKMRSSLVATITSKWFRANYCPSKCRNTRTIVNDIYSGLKK